MRQDLNTFFYRNSLGVVVIGCILMAATLNCRAQGHNDTVTPVFLTSTDSIGKAVGKADSIEVVSTVGKEALSTAYADSVRLVDNIHRNMAAWHPDPQRALWMALVLPGAGQIYNRKYWKLPIIYGGFMGCLYAMNWNNMMYKDYSQAYLDIMDDDPNTASYNKFLHLGKKIDSSNEERYKRIFKSRKDRYRRWRDMSFFCMLGVYALSVIDAYVDAELSEFDISKDLSLRVEPAVMTVDGRKSVTNIGAASFGLNCSLRF